MKPTSTPAPIAICAPMLFGFDAVAMACLWYWWNWVDAPRVLAPPLLHRVDHVEDRQIHRDHHTADDHAQEHDHDRLHQAQKPAHCRVDLSVVEVRDLRQHF